MGGNEGPQGPQVGPQNAGVSFAYTCKEQCVQLGCTGNDILVKSHIKCSGPCILRPPIWLEKYGLKLQAVLK